jgi:hypothetical protein
MILAPPSPSWSSMPPPTLPPWSSLASSARHSAPLLIHVGLIFPATIGQKDTRGRGLSSSTHVVAAHIRRRRKESTGDCRWRESRGPWLVIMAGGGHTRMVSTSIGECNFDLLQMGDRTRYCLPKRLAPASLCHGEGQAEHCDQSVIFPPLIVCLPERLMHCRSNSFSLSPSRHSIY